jgi:hypothetical protein
MCQRFTQRIVCVSPELIARSALHPPPRAA